MHRWFPTISTPLLFFRRPMLLSPTTGARNGEDASRTGPTGPRLCFVPEQNMEGTEQDTRSSHVLLWHLMSAIAFLSFGEFLTEWPMKRNTYSRCKKKSHKITNIRVACVYYVYYGDDFTTCQFFPSFGSLRGPAKHDSDNNVARTFCEPSAIVVVRWVELLWNQRVEILGCW